MLNGATSQATAVASATALDAAFSRADNRHGVEGEEENGEGAEPAVKKRRTKNFKWREDMIKTRASLAVRVPPLDPPTFATWDQFIDAWRAYMMQTKTLYRRRSSSTTASWNAKNRTKKFPIPDSFQYATMAYWCTHGCIQPSRGTGVRAHLHNRFTGCTARITADVVYEKRGENDMRWFIRVRNQIVQHNHKINDEIYKCYSTNSSVPDEILLGTMDNFVDQSSPSKMIRSFDGGEAEFEGTERTIAADPDAQPTINQDIKSPVITPAPASTVSSGTPLPPAAHPSALVPSNSLIIKEVLAGEQKVNMARSELEPLIQELERTPSRFIHKRLQDVSEMVLLLLEKWHRDRTAEDRTMSYFAGPQDIIHGGHLIEGSESSFVTASSSNSVASHSRRDAAAMRAAGNKTDGSAGRGSTNSTESAIDDDAELV